MPKRESSATRRRVASVVSSKSSQPTTAKILPFRQKTLAGSRDELMSLGNGRFAIAGDWSRHCVPGYKLARLARRNRIRPDDQSTLRSLLQLIAEDVEIDISHPDIVETFWTLAVWMLHNMRRDTVAYARASRRIKHVSEIVARYELPGALEVTEKGRRLLHREGESTCVS